MSLIEKLKEILGEISNYKSKYEQAVKENQELKELIAEAGKLCDEIMKELKGGAS